MKFPRKIKKKLKKYGLYKAFKDYSKIKFPAIDELVPMQDYYWQMKQFKKELDEKIEKSEVQNV